MNTSLDTLVRDIIGKTRFILTDPGHWTKGTYSDGLGAFCSVGAMREAKRLIGEARPDVDDRVIHLAYHQAEIEVAQTRTGVRHHDWSIAQDRIISFNDMKTTKHEDVLALLDKALEATS